MTVNTDAVMVVALMIAATCFGMMGVMSWLSWREERASREDQAAFYRKLEELLRR